MMEDKIVMLDLNNVDTMSHIIISAVHFDSVGKSETNNFWTGILWQINEWPVLYHFGKTKTDLFSSLQIFRFYHMIIYWNCSFLHWNRWCADKLILRVCFCNYNIPKTSCCSLKFVNNVEATGNFHLKKAFFYPHLIFCCSKSEQ